MRLSEIETPAYVIDEERLRENLEILSDVEKKSGARILLAQKAFSAYSTYPLIAKYISGCTSSGLYEARLSYEEMTDRFSTPERKLENHVFEPAFKGDEFAELCEITDHVTFNSLSQLERHRSVWEKKVRDGELKVGLRINPEYSAPDAHEIYDPCAKGSRLGIRRCDMPDVLPKGVTGLHFHNLCEENFEPLKKTFEKVEREFADYFPDNRGGEGKREERDALACSGNEQDGKITWINLGGGHHITRDDYDRDGLIELIRYIKDTYGVEVYLEPGEAIALNAGYLVTTVMDIVETDGLPVLILDTSAACHMPDVLEMPYRPPLRDAGEVGEKAYSYRLSSRTCLAGDIIGDYSFDKEIKVGDRLIFEDMAIYSMVKNNTFNGMPLPDIDILRERGNVEVIKHFGYEDFKGKL